MADLPVLIVGAGPVGLMTAVLLTQQGIKVRIIDQKETSTQTSNALGVQARTLELLDTIGLAKTAIERGLIVPHPKFYTYNKELFTLTLEKLDSAFAFILALPQSETEKILIERLHSLHVQVERSSTLTTIKQSENDVQVMIEHQEKQEVFTTSWLLACDGYHSKIRELTRIEYLGEDLPQHFIMMDGSFSVPPPDNGPSMILHPNGPCLIFPLPQNQFRLVTEISHDPEFKDVKHPDLPIFQTLANRRCCFPIKIDTITWQSAFWIHERLATHYRLNRIFLLGDAAHAHSPAGGQGMNTGIQDAFNLAWKLALVIKNQAQDSLLDTYEKERRPVAKAVIKQSTAITKIGSLHKGWLVKLRDMILPLLINKTPLGMKLANKISELDIRYPHPKNRLIGKRAAQFNPQYQHLLVIFKHSSETSIIAQWLNEQYADHISIEHVDDKIQSGQFDYWLIRPDQYIGFAGNTLEELKNHLSTSGYFCSQ